MADVVLFHHLRGLTGGVHELAEGLRAGGHTVHTPDLFDGRLPDSVEDGSALVKGIGADVLDERADEVVAGLPETVVFAGVSWGVMLAQRLAQTRPGTRGALLLEACLPVSGEWAIGPWPDGVPVQVHGMEQDPFFGLEGDLDAARELVEAVPNLAELFGYPGDQHLFTDSSLTAYDAAATDEVLDRVLGFVSDL
jgi:dienelactone hydrolase